METIHIHEDDEGMRNLYPLAAYAEAKREIGNAATVGQRSRAPSGFGYTELYLIEEPTHDYVAEGLRLEQAAAVLAEIFPRVRIQALGALGSHEEACWAFGLGMHCYVRLEPVDDLVKAIWYDIDTDDVEAQRRLRRAIMALDALAPSVIADFRLNTVGPAGDAEFLDGYFDLLNEQRRAAKAAWARYQKQMKRPGPWNWLTARFGRS